MKVKFTLEIFRFLPPFFCYLSFDNFKYFLFFFFFDFFLFFFVNQRIEIDCYLTISIAISIKKFQ